jgi:hypothetical protein
MERIVLHTASRYLYRKLTVALAGLAVGLVILRLGFTTPGWITVAVSAIYGLLQLRSLGEEQERVVIDDSGIRDSLLPIGLIGWGEVRGASVQKVGSVDVVALQLRDPEPFIRRLPPARQFIARKALENGLPGVYLSLVGTDGDAEKIAELIRARVEGRGSRA